MKKTLIYGAATAVVALSLNPVLGLSTCSGDPGSTDTPPAVETDEPIEDVYGAPVDFEENSEESQDQLIEEEGVVEDVVDVQNTLYGPPPA